MKWGERGIGYDLPGADVLSLDTVNPVNPVYEAVLFLRLPVPPRSRSLAPS